MDFCQISVNCGRSGCKRMVSGNPLLSLDPTEFQRVRLMSPESRMEWPNSQQSSSNMANRL